MGRIKQEVKVNESVFILDDIMMTLYDRYKYNLPPKLREEMKTFSDNLREELTKDYIPELDIIEDDLVEHLVFKGDEEKVQFPKELISFYDLLTMYNENKELPKVVEFSNKYGKAKYIRFNDTDGSFRYYEIENKSKQNDDKGFYTFLGDCFVEGTMLEKCIKIIK